MNYPLLTEQEIAQLAVHTMNEAKHKGCIDDKAFTMLLIRKVEAAVRAPLLTEIVILRAKKGESS